MTDPYRDVRGDVASPAIHAAAITPNDSVDLEFPTRSIFVGGDGNLAVIMKGGETVTFTGVVAGMVYPIRVTRVLATGTTAANLVGLR